MFVDEVKVFARAGHGGKGAVAFHREAYVPKGGPSGGNGGRGGNVILQADHDLNNLVAQFYTPRMIAENGEGGMGKGMDGKAGKDLIIKVPCGTLVWRFASDNPPSDEEQSTPDDPMPRSIKLATGQRPVLRHGSGGRAMEIDLSKSEEPPAPVEAPTGAELVADLTTHEQQFI
jgi:GTPase